MKCVGLQEGEASLTFHHVVLRAWCFVSCLCSIFTWACWAQSESEEDGGTESTEKKQVDRILAPRDKDESTHAPFLLKALGEVTFGTGSRPVVGDLGSCSEHSCF